MKKTTLSNFAAYVDNNLAIRTRYRCDSKIRYIKKKKKITTLFTCKSSKRSI